MQVFNPYLPSYEYVPDCEPRVFGDRLYVFGSHDAFDGSGFCIKDYVCWSAPVDDLSAWRYDGVIYSPKQDPQNTKGRMNGYAPDVVQGPDGRFYLYYQLHELTITSVAVCDVPNGKYEFYGHVRHPDGHPWGSKKGEVFAFDPGVLVDDDKRVYLYVGFSPLPGLMKKMMALRGNNLEEAVCLELEPDMVTVKGGEKPALPGPVKAKGTEFEGHAFFEASSPRKIGGKYYLVYSSELSHELCYAVSRRPDGEFRYGGSIISIGDVGYRNRKEPDNYIGNTHGGMVQVGDQWYIFYHRQTNKQNCARQGCAEKIRILPDGSIPQVETTSCGLNAGPLSGKGTYEARIACNLYSKHGAIRYNKPRGADKKRLHPYFTQSGEDREENGDQYIANMKDGAVAGFKYFSLSNRCRIYVTVRGTGSGALYIHTDLAKPPVAQIHVTPTADWTPFCAAVATVCNGIQPLYFCYHGNGYIDFYSFTLE